MAGKSGRRKAMICLSLILIFVLMCSAPEVQTDWRTMGSQPVQAGPLESRHEFMLPVSLPESQVFNGAFIASTRFMPIQRGNKLLFAVLSSILLFGCLGIWKHSTFRIVQYIHQLKPEMSLRMGGHAPPAVIYV